MNVTDTRIVFTDFDLHAVGDEWESLVSAGQMIAEAHDRNRWTLGDLGVKVERRYGEESIKKYAAAINIRPSTMYDYTACSGFYDDEDRASFPPLNWSHYRAALKAKTRDFAMTWLARAADEGWTVEQLDEALKVANGGDPKPQKLIEIGGEFRDCRPVVDSDGVIKGYDLVFRVADSVALKPREVYTLKVYGFDEPEGGG